MPDEESPPEDLKHIHESDEDQKPAASWSREEEAALVRKLDWRLMPFAMLMFAVAFL
ncbi:hypothetical protein HDU93_009052, partial [Gonapodya sp. JEL0774]